MTATLTATPTPTAAAMTAAATGRRAVAGPGIVAGLAAAAATSAVAATARAAGIDLTIEGQPIPLLGFANLTAICALLGVALAAVLARRAARPRRTFVRVTGTLTALSLVPPFLVPAAASTVVVLVLTHLVAAAIVIPALAARLR
jgi:hypothetical protein